VKASGAEAASDTKDVQSPETYVGYRDRRISSRPAAPNPNVAHLYEVRLPASTNGGVGAMTIGGESAFSMKRRRHHVSVSRPDLHLSWAPDRKARRCISSDDRRSRARREPRRRYGRQRHGVVTQQRLYQLVRQSGEVADHTFTIEFLDPACRPSRSLSAEGVGLVASLAMTTWTRES